MIYKLKSIGLAVVLITILTSSHWSISESTIPVLEPIVVVSRGPDYELKEYLNEVGMRESNNKYNIISKTGYLGKYQFHPRTLAGLGSEFRVSKKEFLSNKELQDSAMVAYLRHNYNFLIDVIEKYNGQTVNGIKMTTSGILAGAHLIGPSGVIYYFDRSFRINRNGQMIKPRLADSKGTHVEEYFQLFAGYNITFALE